MRSLPVIVSLAALVTGVLFLRPTTDLGTLSSVASSLDGATRLLNGQPGFFVLDSQFDDDIGIAGQMDELEACVCLNIAGLHCVEH